MNEPLLAALADLYAAWAGAAPTQMDGLAAAASKRQYFRLHGAAGPAIATYNTDVAENRAFVEFAGHFHRKGLPVPEVFAARLEEGLYLQEDLGDTSLYSLLPKEGTAFSAALQRHYRQVVEVLPRLQVVGGQGLDYSFCYPQGDFDAKAMYWDLQYFKYYYLKLLEFPFDERALDADFEWLANWLASAGANHFMLRDCQSRNIILKAGQPFFIDFQGGRRGPLQYDLVSLLWQAKANIPQEYREQLVTHYLDSLAELQKTDRAAFLDYYYGFVLIRTLQVLGAYGLRGLVQKKTHFIQSIPQALANASLLLEAGQVPVRLKALRQVMEQIVGQPPEIASPAPDGTGKPLVVTVQSFSFKRGLPVDENGHGGGFIFDCRSLHNPGRYAPYRKLTGRDPEVQQFLLERSRMPDFLQHVYGLVDEAVRNYLERGFESLTVNFGCTGGQHRSVFAADQLTRHLRDTFNVKVELCHIEQERKGWVN